MSVAARALAGRREAALLDLPSVRRMADVLAARCRDPSWARTLVAALDRFRTLTGEHDLEDLLARARAGPGVADAALADLAVALSGHPDTAVAALAMGPKVWFRLNGAAVTWRPLPAAPSPAPAAVDALDPAARVVLLALVGSGLHRAELLRLRVGDLGALDAGGALVPDPEAEPLAARYVPARTGTERLTFFTLPARRAILEDLARRRAAGLPVTGRAPLVAGPDGRPASRSTVGRAARRAGAPIRVGNQVNVELCRTTGAFFREWGLPGARFVPIPDDDGGDTK